MTIRQAAWTLKGHSQNANRKQEACCGRFLLPDYCPGCVSLASSCLPAYHFPRSAFYKREKHACLVPGKDDKQTAGEVLYFSVQGSLSSVVSIPMGAQGACLRLIQGGRCMFFNPCNSFKKHFRIIDAGNKYSSVKSRSEIKQILDSDAILM